MQGVFQKIFHVKRNATKASIESINSIVIVLFWKKTYYFSYSQFQFPKIQQNWEDNTNTIDGMEHKQRKRTETEDVIDV